ncbi:MAG: MerR family transcriptional regulator, partial [Lachnospiraceae bacterium]|nr:MerR family transcriptional regulator [Lachnospiraceae bacterium]
MKNYYKISEISKLYDIGVDSLRYYERLGILTPRRDTNGYRLYNLTDLYKLNLIRDLRALDFSMSQIKDYLDEQSVQNTLDLLYQEQALVDQELERLTIKKRIISDRIHALSKSQEIKTGLVEIKTF